MTRTRKILIALDQLVNAICNGWPDETISSRAWRWEMSGKRNWPRKIIDAVFFWEKGHCQKSFENEKSGGQLPPSLRQE